MLLWWPQERSWFSPHPPRLDTLIIFIAVSLVGPNGSHSLLRGGGGGGFLGPLGSRRFLSLGASSRFPRRSRTGRLLTLFVELGHIRNVI